MKNKIINLRFLAILLVVFGHSIIIYDPNWGIYKSVNSVPILQFIKELINIIQMPLFIFLSGFLFYYSISKINFDNKKFIINKIKRIIIPFIIFGILYLLPVRHILDYENFTKNSIIYNIFINIFLGKDSGHL